TCGADTECLYKLCTGGTCQALADLNETCAQDTDCYSGTCTGNVCTCTGNCTNKYTVYQPFIQVQKIAADNSVVTLAGTEYKIQELAKCVQDTNPKGLAVIPNTPPELGSTLKILYESETIAADNP
ncbi:MAG: hypothetical protein KC609_11860, partial [Myxococcales bacterium]|nr:hypothetical protein [Myxococcales bacterium]